MRQIAGIYRANGEGSAIFVRSVEVPVREKLEPGEFLVYGVDCETSERRGSELD